MALRFDEIKHKMTKKAEEAGCIVFEVESVDVSRIEPAEKVKVGSGIEIRAIGWPKNWQYQPKPNGLAWLGCSVRGAK